MIARRCVLLLVAVALAACGKDKPKAPPTPRRDTVEVTVDGARAGAVDPARAAAFAPLGSVLPAGKQDLDGWASIVVARAGGRDTVAEPAKAHPGQVAAFYPGPGGISLGFFDPAALAKRGAPAWHVDGVTAVEVTTAARGGAGEGDGEGGGGEDQGDRPAPTAALSIEIASAAGVVTFTGDKLAALPTTHAPVGDTETPGWTLGQVLEAAGVTPAGKVVVYGAEDANLILEPADLDPAQAVAFIKLNRSGQLRFRLFRKHGDTYDLAGELRGIVRIDVK